MSVLVNFVVGIFSLKIISIYLGTSGMALTGSFRNFSSLFKSFTTTGFSQSFIKLFVENKDDKEETSKVVSTFFWLFIIVAVLFGLLIILFSESLSFFILRDKQYSLYIALFGLLLPFVALQSFITSVFNGLLWYKKIVVTQIVSSILVFITTVFLIYYHGIKGALVAIALTDVIMFAIIVGIAFRYKSFFHFDLNRLIAKKYTSVIVNFSVMAVLSGILIPLNFILIRNLLIDNHSLQQAGIWDAVVRISGFYMIFFTTGLSFYYIPKLASIDSESGFKSELKNYFKTIIPLFIFLVVGYFFLKDIIIKIALTEEFQEVKTLLYWQLGGDFIRLLTLAFGYQILVKTMMKRYFAVELLFHSSYFILSYFLIQNNVIVGALQAYCIANALTLGLVLIQFRKTFFPTSS